MYFEDAIECPECGLHTHELTESPDGEVLMCNQCWEDAEEGGSIEDKDFPVL